MAFTALNSDPGGSVSSVPAKPAITEKEVVARLTPEERELHEKANRLIAEANDWAKSREGRATLERVTTATTANEPSKRDGDVFSGRLDADGEDFVLVAVTTDAYDELVRHSVDKDGQAIAVMVLSGDLFQVPRGTRVRRLGSKWSKARVRILSGDSIGRSGWVPAEWVK